MGFLTNKWFLLAVVVVVVVGLAMVGGSDFMNWDQMIQDGN